jgi:hypothetical protein
MSALRRSTSARSTSLIYSVSAPYIRAFVASQKDPNNFIPNMKLSKARYQL